MDRTLTVRTPESIAFAYELAGLGSRFLAVLADLAIQCIVLALVLWGIVALGSHAPRTPLPLAEERWAQSAAIALIIFIVFAIFFAYFIVFEAAWNGQTPGKRLVGIRVVRDGGYPVDFMGSLIRNLIRTVEFGLGFYALSAVVMLFSAENKRLGDYAAGTIVVRDARLAKPVFTTAHPAQNWRLSAQERGLVARFMDRRAELLPQNREHLVHQIAALLRSRVADSELMALDDETLIERVDSALR